MKNLIKIILKKKVFKDEYNFEEVGNFIYTINLRELEKFLLGKHQRSIASKKMNDHYFKNIEYIPNERGTLKERIICFKLKSAIILKNILSKIGLINHTILDVVLFKKEPDKTLIKKMKNYKWIYKRLPENPYLWKDET